MILLIIAPLALIFFFGLLVLDAHLVTTPPKRVPRELSPEEEEELFDLPWNWEDTPLPRGDKT